MPFGVHIDLITSVANLEGFFLSPRSNDFLAQDAKARFGTRRTTSYHQAWMEGVRRADNQAGAVLMGFGEPRNNPGTPRNPPRSTPDPDHGTPRNSAFRGQRGAPPGQWALGGQVQGGRKVVGGGGEVEVEIGRRAG